MVQQRASDVEVNCRVGQLKKVAYQLSENIVQDGVPVSYNSTRPVSIPAALRIVLIRTCNTGRQSSYRAASVRHNHSETGIHANYIQEFSSYFTEIKFRVHNKDQSVNDVQGLMVFDQLDAQFYYIIHLFQSSTCFEQTRVHHQEVNCINTASGKVTLCE